MINLTMIIVFILGVLVHQKFDIVLLKYICQFLLVLLAILSVVGLIFGIIEFNRKKTIKIFLGILINIIPILYLIISFIIASRDILSLMFGIKI